MGNTFRVVGGTCVLLLGCSSPSGGSPGGGPFGGAGGGGAMPQGGAGAVTGGGPGTGGSRPGGRGTGGSGTGGVGGSAGAGSDKGCGQTSLLPIPDDPAARGPWDVGVRTAKLGRLTIEIVYPAEPGSTAGKPEPTYDVRDWLPPQ